MSSAGSTPRPRPLFAGIFFAIQQVGGVYERAARIKALLLAQGGKYVDDPLAPSCNIVFVFPPEGDETNVIYRETGKENTSDGLWTYERICLQLSRRRASVRANKFVLGAGWVEACINAGKQLAGERWNGWEVFTKPLSRPQCTTPMDPPAAVPPCTTQQPDAMSRGRSNKTGLFTEFNDAFSCRSFHVLPGPFKRMIEGSIVNEGGALSSLDDAAFVFYQENSQTPLPRIRGSQRLLSLEWIERCLEAGRLVPLQPFLRASAELPGSQTVPAEVQPVHKEQSDLPAGSPLLITSAPQSNRLPAKAIDPRIPSPVVATASSARTQPPTPPPSALLTASPTSEHSDTVSRLENCVPQASAPQEADLHDEVDREEEVTSLETIPVATSSATVEPPQSQPPQSQLQTTKTIPRQSSALQVAINRALTESKERPANVSSFASNRTGQQSSAPGIETSQANSAPTPSANSDTTSLTIANGSSISTAKANIVTRPAGTAAPRAATTSRTILTLPHGPRSVEIAPAPSGADADLGAPESKAPSAAAQEKHRHTGRRHSLKAPSGDKEKVQPTTAEPGSAPSGNGAVGRQLPTWTTDPPRQGPSTPRARAAPGSLGVAPRPSPPELTMEWKLVTIEFAIRQWLVDGECTITGLLLGMVTDLVVAWRSFYKRHKVVIHKRIPQLDDLPFRHVPNPSKRAKRRRSSNTRRQRQARRAKEDATRPHEATPGVQAEDGDSEYIDSDSSDSDEEAPVISPKRTRHQTLLETLGHD